MTLGSYLESLGMLAHAACMYADEVKRGVPQYIEAAEKTLRLLAIEFAKTEAEKSESLMQGTAKQEESA